MLKYGLLTFTLLLGLSSCAPVPHVQNKGGDIFDQIDAQQQAPKVAPVERLTQEDWLRMKDCSEKGEREFTAEGHRRAAMSALNTHYNRRLQRCFVLFNIFDNLNGGYTHTKTLFDGLDGQDYGSYMLIRVKGRSAPSPDAPDDCNVLSLSGEKVVCKSVEEFDSLVNVYMEWPPKPSDQTGAVITHRFNAATGKIEAASGPPIPPAGYTLDAPEERK